MAADAYEGCGWESDHDEEVVWEDETGYQWTCRRCGAEGWEDLDGSGDTE